MDRVDGQALRARRIKLFRYNTHISLFFVAETEVAAEAAGAAEAAEAASVSPWVDAEHGERGSLVVKSATIQLVTAASNARNLLIKGLKRFRFQPSDLPSRRTT